MLYNQWIVKMSESKKEANLTELFGDNLTGLKTVDTAAEVKVTVDDEESDSDFTEDEMDFDAASDRWRSKGGGRRHEVSSWL